MIAAFLCLLILVSMVMPMLMVLAFRENLEVVFSPDLDRRDANFTDSSQLAGRQGFPGRRVGGGSRNTPEEETADV